MYQVNFLPWRIRAQRQRCRFWLRVFSLQLLVAIAILISLYTLLRYQQEQRKVTVELLIQQHNTLSVQLDLIQQLTIKLALLDAEKTRRQQNIAHNQRYLHVLQQLSLAVPPTLWLTIFEANVSGITLHGIGRDYETIVQFEQSLAELPLLQEQRLAEVIQRKDALMDFTLTARWGKDG